LRLNAIATAHSFYPEKAAAKLAALALASRRVAAQPSRAVQLTDQGPELGSSVR